MLGVEAELDELVPLRVRNTVEVEERFQVLWGDSGLAGLNPGYL